MPTDAERWRFLADHALSLHTDGGDYGYMVHWCRTSGPGEPPKFYPISNGRTADEAIDRAIERYNRKHGVKPKVEVQVDAKLRLLLKAAMPTRTQPSPNGKIET